MQRAYNDYDRKKAVAVRERKRMVELDFSDEPPRKVRIPRGKVRFRLTIRDEKIGDSLTLSLRELPWRGRFVTSAGKLLSTHQIQTAIGAILNHE